MTDQEKMDIIDLATSIAAKKSRREQRARKKMPFRKKMVIGITLFLFAYVAVSIYLFIRYQMEMHALTAAVFAAATGEYWQLSKIQQKIQDGRNQDEQDQ